MVGELSRFERVVGAALTGDTQAYARQLGALVAESAAQGTPVSGVRHLLVDVEGSIRAARASAQRPWWAQ